MTHDNAYNAGAAFGNFLADVTLRCAVGCLPGLIVFGVALAVVGLARLPKAQARIAGALCAAIGIVTMLLVGALVRF